MADAPVEKQNPREWLNSLVVQIIGLLMLFGLTPEMADQITTGLDQILGGLFVLVPNMAFNISRGLRKIGWEK